MASFEQHVNVAVVATGLLIAPLHSANILDINQSLIVLALGVLGGVLPDLDSDNSKPVQISFKILSIFIPLLVLLSVAKTITIFNMVAIWTIASVLLHLIFTYIFLKLTTHRGIFHSIPMGIVFAQVTAILFDKVIGLSSTFSTIAGIFLLVGFLVHLLLDELFSVNALGLSIKKSAGTAFKLYDKNNIIGTASLYAIIAGLFFMFPVKLEIFTKLFDLFKNITLI